MVASRMRGLAHGGSPQYVGVPTKPFMTRPNYLGLNHQGFVAGDPSAAIEQLVQAKDLARVRDASFDLVLRRLAQLQPKGEVVIDAHVRIERVALEDHRDVAVLGGDVVHDPVADQEPAVADLLQSGHAAQCCRLATSGRSHQDQELAIVDLEVEVVHGEDVAGIALDHVVKGHRGHRTMLPPRTREAGERGACPAAS